LIFASAGLAGTMALWYLAIRTPPIPRRALRIGFENVPPVQIRTDSGVTGLAVEIVREAAKRAGVSLQWVETGTSSEEALRRGLVDLWPIMVDLPDRRKHVHITRPWLHTSHILVLPVASATPDRRFAGRIAFFKVPIHARLVREEFPDAQLVQLPDIQEVAKAVCRGTVSAGFLEDRAALTVLREKPAECSAMALRAWIIPGLTLQLGIGSTFQAAGAADKIRDEIGGLYRDGTLAATIAKYSYYGLDDTWTTYDLMEAGERARWVAWGIAGLVIALAVTVWQAASLRQRKRSETALRESEERFRAIFQQAAVGVAQLSLETRVEFANECYCRIIGYTQDEALGKGTVDFTHGKDLHAELPMLRRLLAGEIASFSMEKRYQRKDGTVVWARICKSLVRDQDKRPKHIIAVAEDITERKQAEAALIESEERFRNMADTAPVMIWVSGPDKLCTFFNQGWLSFTGSTLDQAIGNGWTEKVHPDDRDRCYASYSSAFDARCMYQTECRLRRAEGEYRWVLATGKPRFESSGAFAGYVGSCTDITDVKRTQEEALARQKLESLGVLAGGIAHDFNNLLGGIVMNSELVLSELQSGSPAAEGVASIRNVAVRAAEIVGQMMAYAGQEDTVFEPVDLSRLLNELLEFLKVSISKRATLRVTLPEKLRAVRANSAQLRQVVLNLITNASEALGEQEGFISVAVTQVKSGESAPTVSRGDYVRLGISDTGCGMTEETQSKIFDPFFSTKFPGRGMGLAAVKGIVRRHGGTINVRSAPGQGSLFEILLPCSSEPAPEGHDIAAPARTGEVVSVDGAVLIVEDEDMLRHPASKMLRREGFTVIEASDGRTGLDRFRASAAEIAVVLLDVTLPGLSGREVLSELRRIQPNVNVIVTSAYSQEQAHTTLGGQQPWLYIRKPYQLNELTGLLRKVYSDKRRMSGHGPAES
jgi:two-component system cell cycle sensor histidine kinase/response regulator CckA